VTVIAFGSSKSSPGVTTTVLALAARWPTSREPLVVEADPSGGELVARLASLGGDVGGLRDTPSTVQLAASSRAGLSDRALLEHLQRLPGAGEVRVLVAPSSPFAASTAMGALVAARVGAVLTGLAGMDVLLDVGRVDAASPTLPMLRELGSIVLVARPTLTSVLHTRELVSSLRGAGVRSSLIVIGDRPYSPSEVAEAIGATALVGVLPDDPVGARALSGDARNAKVLGRTRLVRACGDLAARLAPPTVPPATALPATPLPSVQPPPPPPSPPPVAPLNGSTSPAEVAP
jgi:hypothetical protein